MSLTFSQPVLNEDGSLTGETETDIPFNLDVLRKHLAHVSLARRVLSDDLAARQKLLEDSVYDVAVQRMRRQAELFKDLGLGDSALRKQDLQLWMWQWHQHLQTRLKEDIALLVKEEAGRFTPPGPEYFIQLYHHSSYSQPQEAGPAAWTLPIACQARETLPYHYPRSYAPARYRRRYRWHEDCSWSRRRRQGHRARVQGSDV